MLPQKVMLAQRCAKIGTPRQASTFNPEGTCVLRLFLICRSSIQDLKNMSIHIPTIAIS